MERNGIDEARNDGFANARNDGFANARNDGFANARNDGFANARNDGFANARRASATNFMPAFVDMKRYIHISGYRLPHWYQEGKVVFTTFRMADSLPTSVTNELLDMKQQWTVAHPEPWDPETLMAYRLLVGEWMQKMVDAGYGSCLLRNPEVRKIVADALQFYDGSKYCLYAYVVMPNHVHVLFSPLTSCSAVQCMGDLKKYTAKIIKNKTGFEGNFWQRNMFDRLVRNEEEFSQYVAYIMQNPQHLPADAYSLYVK